MDTTRLERRPERIQAALQELPDGRVIAKEEVKIYVPYRYIERGLAYVGIENHILGIYAITVGDVFYGVSLIDAMIPIEPSQTNKVKIEGDDYFEFVFEKGGTVFKSLDLVCTDTIVYQIYDEFLAKGNIPWYLGMEDLSHIFDTAKKHANANVGQEQEVTQLIVSIMARDQNDRTKTFRTKVESLDDLKDPSKKPALVPLMGVRHTASNTLNKLAGSYFGQGVIAALLNPSERVERIENLLRR